METTLNIPAYTTGPRAPVPECQRQYWSRNAGELISAYAAHFASLSRDDPSVEALTQSQSWGPSGDHLDARLQEQCTPAHFLSMMEVWISTQVAGITIPPSAPMAVDANLHNASPASPAADNVVSPSLKFHFGLHLRPRRPMRHSMVLWCPTLSQHPSRQ